MVIVLLLACWLFAAVLFKSPLRVLPWLLPLAALLITFATRHTLDHAGVTYEVDGESIILWRNGQVRRRVPLSNITDVTDLRGTIRIRKRGKFADEELLHPVSRADELIAAIKAGMQNNSVEANDASAS